MIPTAVIASGGQTGSDLNAFVSFLFVDQRKGIGLGFAGNRILPFQGRERILDKGEYKGIRSDPSSSSPVRVKKWERRSEERRVGKECRSQWAEKHKKEKRVR